MAGNDSNTKVMLHLDGTNGSTSFPDVNVGGSAHTWSATGAAKVSTTASEFGGASLAPSTTDGNLNTNYVSAAASADWNFGSGNFTIDCWVQINNGTTDKNTNGIAIAWYDGGAGARGFRLVYLNGQFLFSWTTDGSSYKTASFTQAISASTWSHIALVRNGSSLLFFFGGASVSNSGTAISADTIFNANVPLTVGGAYSVAAAGFASVNGYVDEFRVSNTARWTSGFTPPTSAYTAIYTLACTAASLALTGVATIVKSYRKLNPVTATFSLTGVNTTVRHVYRIMASAASFVVSAVSLVVSDQVAPASKFALRLSSPTLSKLRTSDPTLDQ